MREDTEGDGRLPLPEQLRWPYRKLLSVMSGKAWRTSLSMPHFFSYRGFNVHHPFHKYQKGCVMHRTP